MIRSRTLCLIPHYFGPIENIPGGFSGGSQDEAQRVRRERVVRRTVAWLKRLSSIMDVEIAVGGVKGKNILPIDIDYSGRIASSFHILWYLLADGQRQFDQYDNILVLEDDILVPRRTIWRMVLAAKELIDTNDIIFPNRIELAFGMPAAVDLIAWRGWKGSSITWQSRTWYEAKNPHSAFLFLSKRQGNKFLEMDFSRPSRTIGEFTTSAFALAHSGYRLFREKCAIPRHYVFHQDSWCMRNGISRLRIIERFVRGNA
jgi:hypothetical protein